MRKLIDISRPKQWKTISGKDLLDKGYPVYGANGVIGYWSEYNHEKETIAIGCRGTCGEVNIVPAKSYINGNAMCLDDLSGDVELRYLYYYLKWYDLKKIISGSTIPQITIEGLKKVEVKVFSKERQKEIIIVLDKLSQIIEKRQIELEKIDDLIKARFIELFGDPEENPFGWDKMPLSEVIINANNGMARRGNDEYGNIVMRLVELQDGYIDYSNPNRIILKDNEKKRYLLRDKDFLFARVNGNPDNVGRCAVFHDIGEEVYHNDHIIRVHFNEDLLDGTFASALLNSDYGKRQLKSQIKTSAGQYTVSQDGIGAIVTILPSMDKQNQFADVVKQIDKSKVAVQKSLEETQLLFDSLMQEYFG